MKKIILFFLICINLNLTAQTLTNGQVYDYLPGDVFQWTYTDIHDMGISCWLPFTDTYHTDSIISKYYSSAGDSVFYSVKSTAYTPIQCNPTLPPLYSSAIVTKSYTNLSSSCDSLITNAFLGFCTPAIDSFYLDNCGRNVWLNHTNLAVDTCVSEAVLFSLTAVEGCGAYLNYQGAYGGEPHYTNTLTYYRKAGVACGTYSTVGVREIKPEMAIHIFPNPNRGSMYFQYSIVGAESGELLIYDDLGKLITQYILPGGIAQQITLNEEGLSNGIYYYKMIVNNGLFASDKIVIIK